MGGYAVETFSLRSLYLRAFSNYTIPTKIDPERGKEIAMPNYTCSKCGETAISKCVIQRSIFPSNHSAAVLSNLYTVKEENIPLINGKTAHVFNVTFRLSGDTEEAALLDLVNWLQVPDVLKIITCDHHWVIQDERCNFGCCVRKSA
jgi:hypothetical protein